VRWRRFPQGGVLQEFSVNLEQRGAFFGAFSPKNGRKNSFRGAAAVQKWHFWCAKVMQMGGKSRAVGTQVWDF
jgi:hypothetical protein